MHIDHSVTGVVLYRSLKREVVMELQNSGFLNTGLRADVSRVSEGYPIWVDYMHVCTVITHSSVTTCRKLLWLNEFGGLTG